MHVWWDRMRRAVVTVLLLLGTFVFLRTVNGHYPIEHWLIWRYAGSGVACVALAASALGLGHVVVRAVLGRALPVFEHLAVTFPIGVFGFQLCMFAAGAFQLYHPALFYALPAAILLLTGRPLYRYLRRVSRHMFALRTRAVPLSGPAIAIIAFGILMLLMLYLPTLLAENAQFDARWKHLRIAEDFVASGGIRVFAEGQTFATRPHFTSFLYAWAFLGPGRLFEHVVLSSQIEFTAFVWTTVIGIPAMIRRLVPHADTRVVWAARFLFPGILVYDSGLLAGADHMGAMYCVPLFLLLLRAWPTLSPRFCLLLGACMAGAATVKYTAATLLLPTIAAVVAARFVFLGTRALRRNGGGWSVVLGPVVAALAFVVFFSPHWLKNWVLYGAPFYPILHGPFSPEPWSPDASYLLEWGYQKGQLWRPNKDWESLQRVLLLMADWSFKPHDWPIFHGRIPVIGSVFTLLIPCLLFLRRTKRIWLVVIWVEVAIFTWAWTHHQDRYLQTLMPLMTAATAAGIVLIWRSGRWIMRSSLVVLLSAQVIWGGDMYFMKSHAMLRDAPIRAVAELLGAGWKGNFGERFRTGQSSWEELSEQLPEDAKLLVHEQQVHLGLDRPSVQDHVLWQYGINYGRMRSPREVYDVLNHLGVTHLFWTETSDSFDSVAGDIMFFDFADRFAEDTKATPAGRVGRMPAAAPSADAASGDRVAVLGCGKTYESGVYRVEDLTVPSWGPRRDEFPRPRISAKNEPAAEELVQEADFVILDKACRNAYKRKWLPEFRILAKRRKLARTGSREWEIYRRKSEDELSASGAKNRPPLKRSPDLRAHPKRLDESKP